MSSPELVASEEYQDLSNNKPNETFEYPDQATKAILGVNSSNILEISSQIIEFIKTNKISIQMTLYLIDSFSKIRLKNIEFFAELYQMISNKFSCNIKPNNNSLANLLHYKGFIFENFRPNQKQEKIINLFSKGSPLYYIAWDKIDELKNTYPNFDTNKEIKGMTPLDCAIKYGSELCFNFLKNMGAKYTNNSSIYAIQNGNKNIFMQMIDDGQTFDNMIHTALEYHNIEIAEYLKSNFGQHLDSIADCMHFGNFDIASYLLTNGSDVNRIYNFFLFMSFIVLQNSLSYYIDCCLNAFFFFSYLLLFYEIPFS
ncbi:hypothetical protein TVAG_178870 [Trichomonas vaginalis G3]|uniref:DUF3447 domain-containing protein n=1 Tax=Trichomonas vaginalis (strain ATCC PRA-98 / G3) TaxID=412133 RepID=A2FR58_TRIV3|nr:protein ubiquitination [Trichomonas vaginalis G3]EAX92610.1 hypothetical protein TVAG_178870 [Trichomonas vaginalis G3]KAI5552687.1 protein ubiquitination [Trichomonas vaginalis G3]|eukprot:XP_001305540.1 hypothetical protein [Trichomonas vaginalis G3]